jgi:hypothetical protein
MEDDMPNLMNRRSVVAGICAGAVPAEAQDASKVQPTSYQVVLDNDNVRVLEFRSLPGLGVCGTGLHSHPPHLTVLLTDASVKDTQNGRSKIVSNKAGDTFWLPAITHETENIGGAEVRALIVELKPVTPR